MRREKDTTKQYHFIQHSSQTFQRLASRSVNQAIAPLGHSRRFHLLLRWSLPLVRLSPPSSPLSLLAAVAAISVIVASGRCFCCRRHRCCGGCCCHSRCRCCCRHGCRCCRHCCCGGCCCHRRCWQLVLLSSSLLLLRLLPPSLLAAVAVVAVAVVVVAAVPPLLLFYSLTRRVSSSLWPPLVGRPLPSWRRHRWHGPLQRATEDEDHNGPTRDKLLRSWLERRGQAESPHIARRKPMPAPRHKSTSTRRPCGKCLFCPSP